MTSLAGKTLGKHRLIEQLGKGGFASVYKAYQPRLDRYVALKILHPFLVEGEEFLARFEREAKAVAALRHPHIVMVHDFDVDEGNYYMVMEYIDGQSLKEKLETLTAAGKRMPFSDIRRIIHQICSALDYAHAQGMLHRDIKPSNVLLNKSGDIFLTDFGIAKIVSNTQFTATGALVGTPAYMSPEQGQGSSISPASDVYSIGILLYELLIGKVPFDADTPLAIIFKHIQDPLPLIDIVQSGLPEGIDRLIYKALAKDPEDRFQTPGELDQALQAVLPVDSKAETVVQIPTERAPEKDKPIESVEDKISEAETRLVEDDGAQTVATEKEPERAAEATIASIPEEKMDTRVAEAVSLTDEQDVDLAMTKTVVSEEPIIPLKKESKKRQRQPKRVVGFALIGVLLLAGLGALIFGVLLPRFGDISNAEKAVTLPTPKPTLEQLRQTSEELGRMYYEEGQVALDRLDYAGAINKYEQAIEAGFREPEVYAQLGWACHEFQYYEQGCSFEEAIEYYSQAIQLDPNQAWFYANRSWTYIHLENWQAALEDAKRASELEPDNPHHWNRIADVYDRMGEFELALDAITHAIEMDPEEPGFFATRAWIYANMGDHRASAQEWTYALELDPENPDFWHERAVRKADLGDNVGALDDYEQEISLDPERAWAYMGRAEAYARMGNSDKAITNMEKAAELEPENPWIFIIQSRLLRHDLENIDAALEAINTAIELEFSNSEAHVDRGELYHYYLDEPELALEEFNLAVEYSPSWADWSFFARAMYYMDTKQLLEAINDLTEVINRSPEGPDGYGHRGSAYQQLGQNDLARIDYEKFVELTQDMPQYEDWRQEIMGWLASNP